MPLDFFLVAHHAPDFAYGPGSLLPRSGPLRAAIVLVGTAVAGGAILLIWALGGLAPAKPPLTDPGTPVTNDMFTITLHEAELVENEILGTLEVRVRADLTSHHTEPFWPAELRLILNPKLTPGDVELKATSAFLERRPDTPAGMIQPEMPEEVVLTWPMPEEETDPEKFEGVAFTIMGAELKSGFTDQSESWFPTDKVIANVSLPFEKG